MIEEMKKTEKRLRCLDCLWCRAAAVGCRGVEYYCELDGTRFTWLTAQRKPCSRFKERISEN